MRLCFAPKKSETAETIGCMEVYFVSNKLTILHSFKEIAVVLFSEECFHEEHRKNASFFFLTLLRCLEHNKQMVGKKIINILRYTLCVGYQELIRN